MEWIYLIINAFLIFLLGLFMKKYIPSYMEEKGKNLATKEDIQEITRKTEEVQKKFKEDFEIFSLDVQFKYDFYFEQYSKLYSKLYALIIQSEYIRHFIKVSEGREILFSDAPFLEISRIHKVTKKIRRQEGRHEKLEQIEEKIETPLSAFNKMQLCEHIINNGEYASQKLLKLAVSYRFAYSYYSGNPEFKHTSCEEAANKEEFRLIREIVCCIVSEYNFLRCELKMEYDNNELKNGIPQL